jgi:hypothetical protein
MQVLLEMVGASKRMMNFESELYCNDSSFVMGQEIKMLRKYVLVTITVTCLLGSPLGLTPKVSINCNNNSAVGK